ncbi:hypothetical protein EST38_g3663 [Candolleomyces aberdarensis]|uniref:Cytochrome P450 n=1 Tax=Candolleomyces aberdarensis TaxID=2316362 RepID=A0A4Q2DPU4_9AGAR|nr:hypothetical protein EST38_g3663 [Candolleomyces aberdarensis]
METISTLPGGWVQDAAVLLGGISLSYYLRKRATNGRAGFRQPPSLKGLPILGNALDIPLENCQQEYSKWAKELNSDIISASALGMNIVVIDTLSIALELMDKRSSRYSSRPETVMAKDLMGWDYLFAMLPYGERWKERRRMFVQHFRPADTSIIRPQEHEFVGRFLVELSRTPDRLFEVIRGSMGGFIISLAYGIPIKARGDPHLNFSEKSVRTLAEVTTPGSNFVDVLPFLKYVPAWLPGAGFQRRARELYYMSDKFRSSPFNEAVSSFGTSQARPSFVSVALGAIEENSVDSENQKQIIKDTAAMFYGAGTDTIVASILSWIWVMLKNPQVQARVHEELDRVLNGRLPEFEDQDQLPYLMATLMESMRLAPPAAIGVPHRSTEDDVYGDYFIPKDSVIIPNVWSMLRREDEYGLDAGRFNPDRFLTPDGQINTNVLDPHIAAFGFGRRSCPGAHIGRSMVWLAAASLATVFEWREPLGEDGKPIDQPEDYETGLLYQPNRFKYELKLRPNAQDVLSELEAQQ